MYQRHSAGSKRECGKFTKVGKGKEREGESFVRSASWNNSGLKVS